MASIVMKKNIGYIPLVIITVLMCYCIYTVMTTNIAFQSKHYIGIIVILISMGALFFNQSISKGVTLFGLIGATFNFIAFTPIIDFFTIGGSIEGKGLDINVQPYSLLILLLFILLNLDFIKSIFKRRTQTN